MKKVILWLIKVFKVDIPVEKEIAKEEEKIVCLPQDGVVYGDITIKGDVTVLGNMKVEGGLTCYGKALE